MMQALMAQATSGMGKANSGGSGAGSGGGGQDGYSVAGNSTNIPAYGPDRLQFSNSQITSSSGSGDSKNTGSHGDIEVETPSSSIINDAVKTSPENTIIPENIPEKYRSALKLYFTPNN